MEEEGAVAASQSTPARYCAVPTCHCTAPCQREAGAVARYPAAERRQHRGAPAQVGDLHSPVQQSCVQQLLGQHGGLLPALLPAAQPRVPQDQLLSSANKGGINDLLRFYICFLHVYRTV